MKQTHLILPALLVILSGRLKAQPAVTATFDPYFVETSDTVSKRGPYTISRNMLQDRNGNYWLATWQGIIRYDGKLFTNFTLKEGLIHFHVLTVFEDKKGDLWFGTVRGGLYRYDGKTFTLFTTKDGLADNTVQCFLEDDDGNMWLGTDGGVSLYNGKTFTNFTTGDGLCSDPTSDIIKDRNGKLWFTGKGGISCYTPVPGKQPVPGTNPNMFTAFTNKEGLPFKNARCMAEDKAGNIWIGSEKGLCRYAPAAGTGTPSFTDFITNSVCYILEDKKGNIWLSVVEPIIASYSQQPQMILYRYDGKAFTKIIQKYNSHDWQIFGITEDSAGDIWFGTMRGAGRYDGEYSHYFWE